MNSDSPTPFDALFDALAGRLGCPMIKGTHGDAGGSAETRVTWVRSGAPKPEPIPYQRARDKVIGRLAHPWTATIYGATDLEVSTLLASLWAQIDKLQGSPKGSPEMGKPGDDDYVPERPGYALAAGKIEPMGEDEHAAWWECDVSVTLYQPVVQATRGTAEGAARLELKPTTPAVLAEPSEVVWPS